MLLLRELDGGPLPGPNAALTGCDYTLGPIVGVTSLAHIGGMPPGNAKAYFRQRPAKARRVHRAMLAGPRTSRRSAARPRRREFELGNAVYSTGPLLIFVLAALLVVGAVSVLALHRTTWMLLVAITIHVVATALVLWVAMALLDEGSS